MGTTTGKGLPYPFGSDGNNVPIDTLALAARIDALFSARTYAEISAFGGSDLWDGRIVTQSDTGTLRPWAGMYAYKASAGIWQAVIPRASASYDPVLTFDGSGAPTYGTGFFRVGRYARFGSQVLAQFVIYCGSVGFSTPGSQIARIALPPDAPFKDSTTVTDIGVMAITDSGGTWSRTDLGGGDSTTTTVDQQQAHSGLAGGPPLQTAGGTAFANGTTCLGLLLYEAAEET